MGVSKGSWRLVGGLVAALVLLIVAVLVATLAGGSSTGPSDIASEPGRCEDRDRDSDISKQVRLTTTEEWIEFELWSIEPFPARALFPVVRIGSRDFSRSLYGDDGRLNTLIFFIPVEEFRLLTADDQVWVYYGGIGGPPTVDVVADESSPWSFGSFNKGLLDCPTTRDAQTSNSAG